MNDTANKCVFFDINMKLIYNMINFLYDDLVVADKEPYDLIMVKYELGDEDLKFVIIECSKEENASKLDMIVMKFICELLLTLPLPKRQFLFALYREFGPDRMKTILNYFGSNYCMERKCKNNECVYKTALNNFIAEKECIRLTGSRRQFIAGEFPIKEVEL